MSPSNIVYRTNVQVTIKYLVKNVNTLQKSLMWDFFKKAFIVFYLFIVDFQIWERHFVRILSLTGKTIKQILDKSWNYPRINRWSKHCVGLSWKKKKKLHFFSIVLQVSILIFKQSMNWLASGIFFFFTIQIQKVIQEYNLLTCFL